MRALVIALLTTPLLLAACGDQGESLTSPATVPDVVSPTAVAARSDTDLLATTSLAGITLVPSGPVCRAASLIRTTRLQCRLP